LKKIRWQIVIVLLALGVIGVLLVGQQPVFLPVSAPAEQPVTGGVYTEGLVGAAKRLNPVLDYYNPVDREVDRLLFSGLLRFNARGLPEYDLVESMGISQDGLKYNFTLRPNAVWHDGQPLTSADVVFTIDLLRSEALPLPADVRGLWNTVEVEALDEHTLQFRLPEPFSPFLDYLTFGVLPQHLLGDRSPEALIDDPFNLSPVGSGPYRFERALSENGQLNGLALARFGGYYNQPAFIDQLIFRYYADTASALAAYRAGEIQGISQISRDSLAAALKEPGLNLYSGRLPRLTLILFNLKDQKAPFLQETSIRRALLLGLNRQRMVEQNYQGQAIQADGPIFPGSWAYYEGLEHLAYDPEGAINLLKAAGYTIPAAGGNVRLKENQSLSFELLYPEGQEYALLAEAIGRDWARLGVAIQAKALPYEELLRDRLEPRLFQAALVTLDLARFPDPDPYPFWHQAQATGGQNYTQWDDRQASEFLEQARVSVDLSERARLYRNFQVRFTSELPALPLFYPVYTYAVSNQVRAVSMGPLFDTSDRFATITSWYLEARRASPAGLMTSQTTPVSAATTPAQAP
jgi:peptide/nickel transport system substrate-binding protein